MQKSALAWTAAQLTRSCAACRTWYTSGAVLPWWPSFNQPQKLTPSLMTSCCSLKVGHRCSEVCEWEGMSLCIPCVCGCGWSVSECVHGALSLSLMDSLAVSVSLHVCACVCGWCLCLHFLFRVIESMLKRHMTIEVMQLWSRRLY